jgi:hypothetical protein
MSTTLQVRDETTFSLAGHEENSFELDVSESRITVRELIRARVASEVGDYNTSQPEYFRGLVQPTDAERSLHGFKMPGRRRIDPEKQFVLAIKAFNSNGFIVLVDDRQVDDLEDEIRITPDTAVTFLKLVPLVGG